MLKKIFQIIFFFTIVICSAQEDFWDGFIRPADFGKPFWADMRSTLIRAEIAYATNSPDYDWGGINTSYRPFVFVNLGAEIPVWSGNFAEGKYGLSVSLPLMIDIWYDRFEWETSPIINTAYRFGVFDTAFIYRLENPRQIFPHFNIYNWSLKVSFLKHESTHIGDELAIHRKDLNLPITRIDVLANYFEMIFTLNDPDNQKHLNHGFKAGFLFNYNFKDGWYITFDSEAQEDFVGPSRFPFEFFLQYQFQSPLFSRGFQIIASAEYRLRERYNYLFSYSGTNDNSLQNSNIDLVNCFNVFAGVRFDNQIRSYFSKIGIGVRYYYGINPYGQFRSMPHYSQFGVAVVFE